MVPESSAEAPEEQRGTLPPPDIAWRVASPTPAATVIAAGTVPTAIAPAVVAAQLPAPVPAQLVQLVSPATYAWRPPACMHPCKRPPHAQPADRAHELAAQTWAIDNVHAGAQHGSATCPWHSHWRNLWALAARAASPRSRATLSTAAAAAPTCAAAVGRPALHWGCKAASRAPSGRTPTQPPSSTERLHKPACCASPTWSTTHCSPFSQAPCHTQCPPAWAGAWASHITGKHLLHDQVLMPLLHCPPPVRTRLVHIRHAIAAGMPSLKSCCRV